MTQDHRKKIFNFALWEWIMSRAGTRLFKNRRLIEYLKEATRSARLGTRSVLGAAGKVEIWIIFDIKHQTSFCENVFLIILHATKLTERLNRFKDHAIIALPSCCKFKYSSIVFFRRLENPWYLITCPGKCTNKLAFILRCWKSRNLNHFWHQTE